MMCQLQFLTVTVWLQQHLKIGNKNIVIKYGFGVGADFTGAIKGAPLTRRSEVVLVGC